MLSFTPWKQRHSDNLYVIGKIEKKKDLIDCIQFTLFVPDMLFR